MDSVVRNYPMLQFDYKIQSNDVLNIHFGSLTDDKFDFLNRMQQDNTSSGGGGAQGASYIINGFLVDLEGNISFPVVGKVTVVPSAVTSPRTVNRKFTNLTRTEVDSRY